MANSTSFGQPNGNAPGRRVGSKTKLNREFQEAYEEAIKNHEHPFKTMMAWAHDPDKPVEIRAAMLKECASPCTLLVRGPQPTAPGGDRSAPYLLSAGSTCAVVPEPDRPNEKDNTMSSGFCWKWLSTERRTISASAANGFLS
jgi:hypothetical protein